MFSWFHFCGCITHESVYVCEHIHTKNGGSHKDRRFLSVLVLIMISPANSTGMCWIQILKDRLLLLTSIVAKECFHAAPVATAGDARILGALRMEDCVPIANQIGSEDARTKRNTSETVTPLRFCPTKDKIPDVHRQWISSRTTGFHHLLRSLSPSFAGVTQLMGNSLLTLPD